MRSDSGIINDKATLPVTELNFGDTESDMEKGIFTLGKLECSDRGRDNWKIWRSTANIVLPNGECNPPWDLVYPEKCCVKY